MRAFILVAEVKNPPANRSIRLRWREKKPILRTDPGPLREGKPPSFTKRKRVHVRVFTPRMRITMMNGQELNT
jgi:hypothetical protein